ncbi:MAG: hypothetical protein HDR97_00545 [Bacteroides sp.]|nr:hypothetical protein [Bacteroides sp.]
MNIELDKLRMLLDAVKAVDEEATDPFADLKDAAWNVLHDNPGYDFDEWSSTLVEQYPTEVVDVFGTNPVEVYAALAEMWDSTDYEDLETGECHTFQEWAGYFATDESVELYDKLVEVKRELKIEQLK